MTYKSDDAENCPPCPPLKPEVPPAKNGDDSSVGDRWWRQSEGCLEWRLASAINTALHFLDYANPEAAKERLRLAREDYLKARP